MTGLRVCVCVWLSLYRHVRPVKRPAAEQHVSNQSVNRRFTDEPHEEQLFDDLSGDGAQRRQSQQQLAEASRLRRILCPHVLLQRALRLLLQVLDVRRVGQAASICAHGYTSTTAVSNARSKANGTIILKHRGGGDEVLISWSLVINLYRWRRLINHYCL